MKELKPDFIKNSIISQFLDDIKESIKGAYNRGTYIKVEVNKGKTNNSDDAIVINVKTTDKSVKLNYSKTIKAIKDACEGYCTASKNEEADTYGQSKGVVKNKDLQLQLIDVKPTTKFIKFVEGDNYNMKDSYYTEAEKKDKKFVKSAIEEMSRYIRNWDYLTKKEKQNIGCSLNELRKRVDELKTVKLEDSTSFYKTVDRILTHKEDLEDYSLEELEDLLVDIVNEREGVEDGTSYANELDDLYQLVDRAKIDYNKTEGKPTYQYSFTYNIYWDGNTNKTYEEEVKDISNLAKKYLCKVAKWEKLTKGPDNIEVTFEGTKHNLTQLAKELGTDDWEVFEENIIKVRDNFCCLVPGLPKLKRADKKFNQPSGLNYKVTDSRKLKDAEYVDYDDGEGPFKSFEELTKYASEYGLDTEVIYPDRITMKCCQWIISGDKEALSDFLTKYYNKDQLEYIHDAKFNDVEPRKNESKEDFISRFMSETKSEYPDRKQRLAVAYSYWNRAKGIKDKKVKDWMPSKTTIDYIKEKLDAEGIEYEIEDDVYGETAPFDTWITITKGDDSRADDIICSVVGSAYEWVRDKDGNRRYCKVVTDEELIDEFNN